MSLKLYSAVSVAFCNASLALQQIIPAKHLHVTMSFQSIEQVLDMKAPIRCDIMVDCVPSASQVLHVEYWEGADITVAVLDPRDWKYARKCFDDAGLTYDQYEFTPHVTLGKGNIVAAMQRLRGQHVYGTGTYIRVKDFK